MPTKLKKPVFIEFKTVELAIATLAANLKHRDEEVTPSMQRCKDLRPLDDLYSEIDNLKAQLTAQGIDYRTWEPPKPLKAGEYDAKVNPDGSIEVGCQTITREQVIALAKASEEAGKVEDVWPKWCRNGNQNSRSIIEFHQDCSKSIWHYSNGCKHPVDNYSSYEDAVSRGLVPITATEAARILEQKEEWPKWFEERDGTIYRIDSESKGAMVISNGKEGVCNWSLSEVVRMGATQITATEASKKLKAA